MRNSLPIFMNSSSDRIFHTPTTVKIMHMLVWLTVKNIPSKAISLMESERPFQDFDGEQSGQKFTVKQMYKFFISQKQLIFQRNIPDTSCIWEICENTSLMAKIIGRFKTSHPTDAHHITQRYCCNSSNQSCSKGACEVKNEK